MCKKHYVLKSGCPDEANSRIYRDHTTDDCLLLGRRSCRRRFHEKKTMTSYEGKSQLPLCGRDIELLGKILTNVLWFRVFLCWIE